MLSTPIVVRNGSIEDAWNVEQFDSEGACLMAIFVGPKAEERAREYAVMRANELETKE
jgi:hypothetical protein